MKRYYEVDFGIKYHETFERLNDAYYFFNAMKLNFNYVELKAVTEDKDGYYGESIIIYHK